MSSDLKKQIETLLMQQAEAAEAAEAAEILKEAQRLRLLRLEAEASFTEEEKSIDRYLKGLPIGGLFYERMRKESWKRELEEWNSPEEVAKRKELLRRQGDEAAKIGYVMNFGINVWEPDFPTLWDAWMTATILAYKEDRTANGWRPAVNDLNSRDYLSRCPYFVWGDRDSKRLEDQGTGLLGDNLSNFFWRKRIFSRDPESTAPEPSKRVGKHFRDILFITAIRGEDPAWGGEPFTGKDLEVFEEFKAFLRTEGIEV